MFCILYTTTHILCIIPTYAVRVGSMQLKVVQCIRRVPVLRACDALVLPVHLYGFRVVLFIGFSFFLFFNPWPLGFGVRSGICFRMSFNI